MGKAKAVTDALVMRAELKAAREDMADWKERALGFQRERDQLQIALAVAEVAKAGLTFERDAYQNRLGALECALVLVTDQLRARMRKAYGPEAVPTTLNVAFDPAKKTWGAGEWALAAGKAEGK